jgi:hypothetical protein
VGVRRDARSDPRALQRVGDIAPKGVNPKQRLQIPGLTPTTVDVWKPAASASAGYTVSYTVSSKPNFSGSANELESIAWHRKFLTAHRHDAVGAMVAWKLLHPAEAQKIRTAAPAVNPATPQTEKAFGFQDWTEVRNAAEKKICAYVQQVFPAGIDCRARYYNLNGVPKQVGQVLIDNTPTP